MSASSWIIVVCIAIIVVLIVGLFVQQEIQLSRLWTAFNLSMAQIPQIIRDSIRHAITGKFPPKDDGGEG